MRRKGLIIATCAFLVAAIAGLVAVSLNGDTEKVQTAQQPVPPATAPAAAEPPAAAPPVSGTQTVVYDARGFTPAEITVTKGTTVIFDNQTEMPMWVATDPHPDHTAYPEFDVLRANGGKYPEPRNDFSFTFDKVGTWTYHNHTNPTDKGKIIVK